MRLDHDVTPYLVGERFSEALTIRIGGAGSRIDRLTMLERLATGKRVIHVGCVDHISVLDFKIANGIWLHGRLMKVAERCLGVDIDAAGVDLLRQRGIGDVILADVTAGLPAEIADDKWDLVVLGEVLEHVDDPVGFLRGLRSSLIGRVDEIVITVPHAMSLLNVLTMMRGQERINSDHRFWFTPYTLAKIATMAEITPTGFALCPSFPPGATRTWQSRVRGVIRELAATILPAGREDLVLFGRLTSPPAADVDRAR